MKYILFFLLVCSVGQLVGQVPAQAKSCVCCESPYQQFSFWEGDWEVFGFDGKKQGSNRVVYLQDKCVLQENWKGLGPGDAGTSYNFYNKEKQCWQQVWISNRGFVLELSGQWTGESMVLKSQKQKDAKGKEVINRLTFTPQPNGDVKQVWQVSGDEEKTWSTQFYGIYKRKPANP